MITKNIKKYIVVACCVGCGCVATLTSCSDMLEPESTRQNIEPEILSKTDSLFYGFGIMQAMQQLADQYVFQGELRGDLVGTTKYTDNNLRKLVNFTADTSNKYDSAYVYYRVINNCNYYIAHRDTAIYTGSVNVVINEYAAVKAIRAWAYLQLARNYGSVPFFTVPLTEISAIDNNQFPEYDIAGIVGALAPDLEQYSGLSVPTYGITGTTKIGSPNWSSADKEFKPERCFIPVDVILGDMYLEVGNYPSAASHFVTYLTRVANTTSSFYLAPHRSKYEGVELEDGIDNSKVEGSQIKTTIAGTSWASIFGQNTTNDIITYIPMAVNSRNGQTTDVPYAFGFNYYATSDEMTSSIRGVSGPYIREIQLRPSDVLNTLSDSTKYHYYAKGGMTEYDSICSASVGDMRLRSIITQTMDGDSVLQWIDKYKNGNIVLYRTSTVLLHLAEAINRMGYYDAAFAILKDGVGEFLLTSAPYVSDDTKVMLQTTYPLLSDANLYLFPNSQACGIHCHGAGKAVSDIARTSYRAGKSPYTLDVVVGKKMTEIAKAYNVSVGTTKQDTINAMEDILCDEYALEFAFEGNRFYDLCRLARHKNNDPTYGASFGKRWYNKKLEASRPDMIGTDFWDESKRFLPF